MAIAYVRARPMRMRRQVSMSALVSYCGRGAVVDPRSNHSWEFRGDGSDMVHEEVVLPIGAAPDLSTPAAFALAIDYAEARRMRKMDGRTRWPQICWTLIVALPPDDELTLDEAIEVTRRLVQQACSPHALPAHFAIHDPAQLEASRGSRNRHAHVSVGLRARFEGPKVRDLWARPRHGRKHGLPATYVAEGISWPEKARDLLIHFFDELGLDNVVDPPAPAPDRHWSDRDLLGDADKVDNYRHAQRATNLALIYGDASILIETLLRGRSTMRIGEIHRLLAKFVDRESDRTIRADEILADSEIVTLGRPTHDGKTTPRFATTRRIFDLMSAASDAIEDARHTAAIRVIADDDHTAVLEQIREDRTEQDVIIVGNHHSECEECAALLNVNRPQIVTVAKAINRESAPELIVAPRAENLADQDLAALILSASENRIRLVLGLDLGSQAGHCRSLASYIVDRLSEPLSDAPNDAASLARSGLVDRALRKLRDQVVFGFAEDHAPSWGIHSSIVCDDPDRLPPLIRRIHETRALLDPLHHPHLIHADGREIKFDVDEWIVFERTLYGPKPPEVRAGGFARVLAIDEERGSLDVDIPGLGARTVDVRQAHPRSAAAIRIREAKQAPSEVELRVEITTPRHAWAAILLAAERDTTLFVDPAVARTLEELVEVARSSLPYPALRSLTPMRDPDAEMHVTFEDILANSHNIAWRADDFDVFPEPANYPRRRGEAYRPAVTLDEFPTPKPAPRHPPVAIGLPSLHERIRSAIASDPHAVEGLRFVRRSIHETNPSRAEAYDKIMKFIGSEKSVAAAVVRAEYSASTRARCPDSLDDEFDLPQSLLDELPAASEEIDIFRACTVLSLLAQRITQAQITPHITIESDTKDPLSSKPYKWKK